MQHETIHAKQISTNLLKWHKSNKRKFPWRNTKDPWFILVAEVLLKQTTATRVAPIYSYFIKRWPTPKDLLNAKEKEIEKAIFPLGLTYRAKELQDIASDIIYRFGGFFPKEEKELLSVKGIGPYTASALMCFSFDAQVAIIDANVLRFLKRITGIPKPLKNIYPNKEMKELANLFIEGVHAKAYNYALLDFTALLCSHYNPKCEICPLLEYCKIPANL